MTTLSWVLVSAGLLCATAPSQCGPLLEVNIIPGVRGSVRDLVEWDPDGPAGPAPAHLVVGGDFTRVVDTDVGNGLRVAIRDPRSGDWVVPSGANVPPGQQQNVKALAALPNGTLAVCGESTGTFQSSGTCVHVWDGVQLRPLGPTASPARDMVRAASVTPSGLLVVAGFFSGMGGVAAANIAVWDGSSWRAMGAGLPGVFVTCVKALSDGRVLAGGNGCWLWDGSVWTEITQGSSFIAAIVELPDGSVVVGGGFSAIGGVQARNVARWDGTTWSELGQTGYTRSIEDIALTASGEVVAVSAFGGYAVLWDGVRWTNIESAPGSGSVLALPSGDIVFGGGFTQAAGVPALGVVQWTRRDWVALGPSSPGVPVTAFARSDDGSLYAAGAAGGLSVGDSPSVWRWRDGRWSFFGGHAGTIDSGRPMAMAALSAERVVVSDDRVLRVFRPGDRTAQSPPIPVGPLPGFPFAGIPVAVAADSAGDLIAGRGDGVWRWAAGASATRLGSLTSGVGSAGVTCLVSARNGDVFAGGEFSINGGSDVMQVARWDGAAWVQVAALNDLPRVLRESPNGELFVGGRFTNVNGVQIFRIAAYDGTSWNALGGSGFSSEVQTLAFTPDGDLVVGGDRFEVLARWTGSTWVREVLPREFWSGFVGIEARPDGRLLIGTTLGNVAVRESSCPASVEVFGASCTGSGGEATLSPITAPWIGGVFRSRVAGVGGPALLLRYIGFGPRGSVLALDAFIRESAPGCVLSVEPHLMDVFAATTPEFVLETPLPDLPAAVGLSVEQQVVQLAQDASGGIRELTSTNALRLVLGIY